MRTNFHAAPLILLALLVSGLAGCLPPAPAPELGNPAALGLSVENRSELMSWITGNPEWIHLVLWNEQDDVTAQTKVVTTNFFEDNRLYLLNAEPGRYAVIATTETARHARPPKGQRAVVSTGGAFRHGRRVSGWRSWRADLRAVRASFSAGRRYLAGDGDDRFNEDRLSVETTFFSEEMIRRTMTEVLPGRFTFMGKLRVVRDTSISDGDKAVRHFHPLQQPQLLDEMGLVVKPWQEWVARGTSLKIERGKKAEEAFLAKALLDLKGSGWLPAVRRALDALGDR